ncbi:MAG: signal peptide peptidase SppA [Bacteroidales bacterium]|nr:signal peptide peptidase SppA [Bacteroidales bacterium]
MKSFLKYTLATITGIVITSLIMFFILIAFIGALISSTEKTVVVESGSVLKIEFSKPIAERTSNNPFKNFDFQTLRPSSDLGIRDIIDYIGKAKTDDNIKGIYLDLTVIPSGIATVEEIREALLDFKKSKKFLISYAEVYTQSSYYLASVADKIYINPSGYMPLVGMRSELMFLKGTFEKLDIEPQIIRHGKYKSAVEPYTNDKMSEANRVQMNALLSGIWNHILKGISDQRNISVEKLNELANTLAVRDASSAKSNKLIDELLYEDEVLAKLAKLSKAKSEDKIEFVSLDDYVKTERPKKFTGFPKNKIAIVYASGDIMPGEGDESTVGSKTTSEAIRKARKDSSVKAIVLRVNSPGGSALASEVIWREVKLASKVKPVIASLGDVAASGGYYIVTPADTIVADNNTITGSIGVFGLMFNAGDFMKNKLGITFDVAKTNTYSDFGSQFRAMTAQEKEVLTLQIEEIYDQFISHVAEGRGLTKAQVDSIGQGRVWNATDALRIGLIDVTGGIEKAIEIAAAKAKLKEYRIVELPVLDDPFESLMSGFSVKAQSVFTSKESYQYTLMMKELDRILSYSGVQARMPFTVQLY